MVHRYTVFTIGRFLLMSITVKGMNAKKGSK